MYVISLVVAIAGEVLGSTMLKLSDGFRKLVPVVLLMFGYAVAFIGLSISLVEIPLGVAYAIWSGVGTALTVVIGVLLFKEGMNVKKFMGIVLVILGVVLLNLT